MGGQAECQQIDSAPVPATETSPDLPLGPNDGTLIGLAQGDVHVGDFSRCLIQLLKSHFNYSLYSNLQL